MPMAAAAGAGEPSPYAEAAGSDLANARAPSPVVGKHLPSGAVPRHAYVFDGEGFADAAWDVAAAAPGRSRGTTSSSRGSSPGRRREAAPPRAGADRAALPAAHAAGDPRVRRHGPALRRRGRRRRRRAGALLLRVSSPGPVGSAFALRLAARVTDSSVVTVSVGGVRASRSGPRRRRSSPRCRSG